MTDATTTGPLDPAFVKLAVILLVGVMAVVFDTTIRQPVSRRRVRRLAGST